MKGWILPTKPGTNWLEYQSSGCILCCLILKNVEEMQEDMKEKQEKQRKGKESLSWYLSANVASRKLGCQTHYSPGVVAKWDYLFNMKPNIGLSII